MEGIVIAPDWLWIIVTLALVAFGGICGSALLWCLHARPMEKRQDDFRAELQEANRRLRHAEKVLAVNDAVYRLHYKHIRREQDLHDACLIAMAREMPTRPPPARS